MKRNIRVSCHHPKKILFLTFILVVCASFFVPNLKQSILFEDQIDPSLESSKQLSALKELFGQSESLSVIFLPKDKAHFNAEDLCQLNLRINEVAFKNNSIDGFFSPFKIRQAIHSESTLLYHHFLPKPCESKGTYNFSPLRNTIWDGSIYSKDSADLFVSFSIPHLNESTRFGRFDAKTATEVMEKSDYGDFEKHWVGPTAQQVYTLKGMAHSQFLNLAIAIIILIGIRLFIGTWKAGILYLSTLLATNIIVYGGMAMMGQPTDALSICLFMVLGVACLEDFIFLSYYKMNRVNKGLNPYRALVTASFFTSLTTVLGFGSLLISPLSSIKQFGLWAAVGASIEWFLVFYVLPSWTRLFPSWNNWVSKEHAFVTRLSERSIRWTPNKFIIFVSLLAFIYPILTYKDFKLSQTPTDIFPTKHPFQIAMKYLESTRGWVANASIVFSPAIPAVLKERVLSEVTQDPLITRIDKYSDTLNFMANKIQDDSIRDLVSREIRISPIADQYWAESGEERINLLLKTSDTELINNLKNKVENLCANKECWLTGDYVAFADYSKQMIQTLFESLFVSLILVTAVLGFLCLAKNASLFWPILISSFWGPAVMLVLIKITNTNVNLVTCIVAGLLVGLTGDNAIQYLFADHKNLDAGIEERGTGSIQCALLMAVSSLVFIWSYFEPPRTLGVLLALGFLFSLIGDLWILKGLLRTNSSKPIKA